MKGFGTQGPKNSDQGGSFSEKSDSSIFLLHKLLSKTSIGSWDPDFDARVKTFDKGLQGTNMKDLGTRKSGSGNFTRKGSTLLCNFKITLGDCRDKYEPIDRQTKSQMHFSRQILNHCEVATIQYTTLKTNNFKMFLLI